MKAQASTAIQNAISPQCQRAWRAGAASDVGLRAHQRAAVRPNRPFGRQIRITIMTV